MQQAHIQKRSDIIPIVFHSKPFETLFKADVMHSEKAYPKDTDESACVASSYFLHQSIRDMSGFAQWYL